VVKFDPLCNFTHDTEFSVHAFLSRNIPKGFSLSGKKLCLTGKFSVAKKLRTNRVEAVKSLLNNLDIEVTENFSRTIDVLVMGDCLKVETCKLRAATQHNDFYKSGFREKKIIILSESMLLTFAGLSGLPEHQNILIFPDKASRMRR